MATVNITTAPTQLYPRVDFDRSKYHSIIWAKGVSVLIEKAGKCPCKTKGGDNLSNCINCGGVGWFFYNKSQTRIVIQNMGNRKDFKEWSVEDSGTASITAMESEELTYMDRVTLLDSKSQFQEILYPNVSSVIIGTTTSSRKNCFTVYPIVSIVDVFGFVSNNSPLVKLTDSQYMIVENRIILEQNSPYNNISVRYIHNNVYHITEQLRETMVTFVEDRANQIDVPTIMPVHLMARKAHYIFNSLKPSSSPDFSIGEVVDNSYSAIPLDPCNVT